MKTKEIDVWVRGDSINCANGMYAMRTKINDGHVKAKLIIEIPEKKIEITESEIKDAIKYHFYKKPESLQVKAFLSELGFKNE